MMPNVLVFCLIALLAGLLGFWGLGLAAAIARGFCAFFLVLFLLSLIRRTH